MKRSYKIAADNHGFSLVELIIVIAIIAVLASAVGMAVVKYITKANNATDVSNADEIYDAIMYAMSDEASDAASIWDSAGAYVRVDKNGTTVSGDNIKKILSDQGISVVCKSSRPWNWYQINFAYDSSNNKITVTYTAGIGGTSADTSATAAFCEQADQPVAGRTISLGEN